MVDYWAARLSPTARYPQDLENPKIWTHYPLVASYAWDERLVIFTSESNIVQIDNFQNKFEQFWHLCYSSLQDGGSKLPLEVSA